MKIRINLRKKWIVFIFVPLICGIWGCVTLPMAPQITPTDCQRITNPDNQNVLFRNDDKVLFFTTGTGGPYGLNNILNSYLYIGGLGSCNCTMIARFPFERPDSSLCALIRQAFISPEGKVYCEYSRGIYPPGYIEQGLFYAQMNQDGTDKLDINAEKFYSQHMVSLIPSTAVFMKNFSQILQEKNYAKADEMKNERIDKLNIYLEKYGNVLLNLGGETKSRYLKLQREKERLENIIGLNDPALCQLREKLVVALSANQYDDATKIYGLIEKMEDKYRPEPPPQPIQVVPSPATQPQHLVVQYKEAPSAGKQMRALSTVATGLNNGRLSSQEQNGWMTLFGLGDLIDSSGN